MRLLLACLALLGLAPFLHAMPTGPSSSALMKAHGPPRASNQEVNSQGSAPATVTVKFPLPFNGEEFASPASSTGSEKVKEAMNRLIAWHRKLYGDREDVKQLGEVNFQYQNEFRQPEDPSYSEFVNVHITGPFYPCRTPCYYQVPYDTQKIPKMYMVTGQQYWEGY
ncbi:hypothetical protein GGU10DRAFT_125000 [Lentinula aff. detonsa]|uniref:Uncharacterized protein n=1 Tax=Lentinula aff. detonsa TaxID=2804958 RepID=A0AA38NBG1_9AGAR|nr:hypothetical protein GGU10DRAFT_125000 [Lentinula aff. detonsa]